MWCGPNAVADLTNWTRDQVWLHIRWLREQRGQRLPDKPRGGTTTDETLNALERAGYRVTPLFRGRRVRLSKFIKTEGWRGRWLLRQNNHIFAYRSDEPFDRAMAETSPNAVITAAYWVEKA
jgi:hypothetical protein